MDPKIRLNELAQGYQHSVVLLTAVKVGVFDALAGGPDTAAALAQRLELDARALEILLLALVGEGLLELADDRFALVADFAPLLVSDSPQTQANILKHNFACMQQWVRLEETLRTGRPAADVFQEWTDETMRNFICGMADISRTSSQEVAEKLDLSPWRRMLDLGGGPATASIVFARRYPELRSVVFDLEGPISIAREQIAQAGLSDRIETQVGDYFVDDFGDGYDLIYISNIIHSMSPDETRQIVAKAWQALEPGGAIIIKEFFLDDTRTAPLPAALFSINMLAGTTGGKSYTFSETRRILSDAGFKDFKTINVAAASALLSGVK